MQVLVHEPVEHYGQAEDEVEGGVDPGLEQGGAGYSAVVSIHIGYVYGAYVCLRCRYKRCIQ